jgi:hypothetical protein
MGVLTYECCSNVTDDDDDFMVAYAALEFMGSGKEISSDIPVMSGI